MIQELFGGAGLGSIANGGGERKLISIHGGGGTTTCSPSLSPSPSPPSSTTTTTATATTTAGVPNPENLRCPRCDSSNTKFCYYNNYNLTQPRHFCKTCRRYWTKGGALRNVPIGGGCRKNKGVTVSTAASIGKNTASGKLKTVVPEIGRSGFISGFDHEAQGSPILWGSPQNSHLFALLRPGHQNPNPNPNPSLNNVKEEGVMNMIGSHMMNTDPPMSTARTLGLDPVCQPSSLGLCNPFWRYNNSDNQNQQPPQHHNQQNGFIFGHEVQGNNIGIQELFQRLRSSASSSASGSYYSDQLSNNVMMSSSGSLSSSSISSSILDSAPAVGGGEMGYWNPGFAAWSSDLPTANGAYH